MGWRIFAMPDKPDVPDLIPARMNRTTGLVTAMRNAMASDQAPAPLEDSPKCPRCSLAGICLPDEINLLCQANGQSEGSEPVEPRRLLAARDEIQGLPVETDLSVANQRRPH